MISSIFANNNILSSIFEFLPLHSIVYCNTLNNEILNANHTVGDDISIIDILSPIQLLFNNLCY